MNQEEIQQRIDELLPRTRIPYPTINSLPLEEQLDKKHTFLKNRYQIARVLGLITLAIASILFLFKGITAFIPVSYLTVYFISGLFLYFAEVWKNKVQVTEELMFLSELLIKLNSGGMANPGEYNRKHKMI